MHEKLRLEFKRLFEQLISTDPGTDTYRNILRNFEMLDSIGPTLNDYLHRYDTDPVSECNEDCADCPNCEGGEQTEDADIVEYPTPAPEPHDPVPEEKPTLTPSEVRARLAEARRNGINVAALIKEFGVDNFTALPATKYADLLGMIENAGME